MPSGLGTVILHAELVPGDSDEVQCPHGLVVIGAEETRHMLDEADGLGSVAPLMHFGRPDHPWVAWLTLEEHLLLPGTTLSSPYRSV